MRVPRKQKKKDKEFRKYLSHLYDITWERLKQDIAKEVSKSGTKSYIPRTDTKYEWNEDQTAIIKTEKKAI